VLWALAQHDLKRLLAYHSVENVGIILMGLGLGALGSSYHHPVLAVLGFTGALLHTLNHALFKSLLFLGAGAVARATGTREIDRLGGLVQAMPGTTWAFLIGAIAIVGLPPLNGFVSEWLIFRGLLAAGATSGALRAASATTAGLALTGALALACFTKLQGVIFLGSPRAAIPVRAGADRGLVAPQMVLAVACITIGLAPFLVIPGVLRATSIVVPGLLDAGELSAVVAEARTLSALVLALLGLALIIWQLRRMGRVRQRETEATVTWGCAYARPDVRMQYTASSYAANLLSGFGPFAGTERIASPTSFHVRSFDPVLGALGRPTWGWIRTTAGRLRQHQTSRIRRYLLYVIFALVSLLLYLWVVSVR
jgi:NADH:ubiquinone oxidoreductase subunit 5 (subunit L)/multisubunit Na+/H+ antiporter MnhA subunit